MCSLTDVNKISYMPPKSGKRNLIEIIILRRYVIYVKGGVYEETVVVRSQMINITMFGDGSRKTIVTGSKNFVDGIKTFHTATFGM